MKLDSMPANAELIQISMGPNACSTSLAADAIHFAAHHRRKALHLGGPTLLAIWGDRVASSLLDHYLARTAVSGQQDAEPVSPGRRDNLFEPVAGDHGAHGRFDAIARARSSQLWATVHRAQLAWSAAILVAGALAWLGLR